MTRRTMRRRGASVAWVRFFRLERPEESAASV